MGEAAPARRGFLVRLAAAAGVSPLVLGVIEGRALAAPHDDGTDVAILHGALALENQALALYDLGRAVRLSGQPQAAVPILERRLQIDNQRSTVDAELQLARQGVS